MPGASDTSNLAASHGRSAQRRLLLAVAVFAVLSSALAYLTGAGASLENSSISLRLSLRAPQHPAGVLLVGIDSTTLNSIHERWPFRRARDAQAVNVLHADHARSIVYDVQFTSPTVESEDLKLYEAVSRAGGVVLATTEIGRHGETQVLGGEPGLREARAHAAAANYRPNSSGVIQRYPYSVGGLRTLPVAAAEAALGHRLSRSGFEDGSAWIDFPGPVGSFPEVSFSNLVAGRVNPAEIAGRIVVIGSTSPVLQDFHRTSVTGEQEMPGPEVQAASIWTAIHGNPLRAAPPWLALLAIVLGGVLAPLACLRIRPLTVFLIMLAVALTYAVLCQVAIERDLILVATYPIAAMLVGALGSLIVSYLIESWERQLTIRYAATLEATVRERTAEVTATQLEVINRLARAAELRDEDTAHHVERVGEMCERLGLACGMSESDAHCLRVASALHDVGKIGVPDSVLLKRGELDDAEWELMKSHTEAGAELLAGSRSPILRMAEEIARTHHERWDGSGYPDGLRGEEIPLVGRICAICDVFDALSAERAYKRAWPQERVLDEIRRKSSTHFDPALVATFELLAPEFSAQRSAASGTRPVVPPQPGEGVRAERLHGASERVS